MAYAPNGADSTAAYDEADQVTHTLAPVGVVGDQQRYTQGDPVMLVATTAGVLVRVAEQRRWSLIAG